MKEKLKIIPLGGLNEIGKNMTALEFGDDIIVIDCGNTFPDDELLGTDLVIPDVTYLIKNRARIRGLFITHGHEDHVGAIPYVLKQINLPIYCTRFTAGLIKLKDGIDPTSDATKLDITENPKNLDIQEIAAEQLPRSLADVDLAVINGNYALQADLNAAEDSLITENPDYAKVYVNVVACRSGEENSDKIQALKKAMQSDDVKKYVDETYKGAVVTVF